MPELSGFEELDKNINPRWKIYVDTCSLYIAMGDNCRFWDQFVPILQKNGCRFIITIGTFEEIKKHKRDVKGKNPELARTAQDLEQTLYKFSKKNLDLMVTVGNPGEFHDQVIQAKIRERALSFNQVYITNDLANAWDVFNTVHNSRSVSRDVKRLLIYKITKGGKLVHYDQLEFLCELNQKEIGEYFALWSAQKYKEADSYLEERTDYRPFFSKSKRRDRIESEELSVEESEPAKPEEDVFVEPAIRSVINPNYEMPSSGAKLHAVRGEKVSSVILGKRIARGGEGLVYTVQSDGASGDEYLAKIYKKTKLGKSMDAASQTMLKINYIVGCGFSSKSSSGSGATLGDRVKFPLYVLVNEEDEFVGYLMRKAKGEQLSTFIANGAVESEFRRLYPSITKIDLVDICISFLKVIRSLHSQNILVGDLNANNILVDTETNEVFLIDADSYQYADKFPCNVGVEKYTSPEFLKDHSSAFRTEQNELFVVARILCEVLMMVDNPYNSKVSESPIADMLAGRFRYTFAFQNSNGERISNEDAPGEELEIRWGQLTRKLKDSFGNTFHKDGAYWEPGQRISTSAWINYLTAYRDEIRESLDRHDDVVSNDVFPTERRKWVSQCHCKVCGKSETHDPSQFRSIIYPRLNWNDIPKIASEYHFECYREENQLVEVRCAKCGSEMGFGKEHRDDGKDYICQDCWEKVPCPRCGGEHPRWMVTEKLCYVSCSKCGASMGLRPPLGPGKDYICKECWSKKACDKCGKETPSWILRQNNGLCNRCRNISYVTCDKCGTRYEGKDQHKYGKDNICQDCWTQVSCPSCGTRYCPNGKTPLAKWMLRESGGVCPKCKSTSRSYRSSSYTPSRGTSSTPRATAPAKPAAAAKPAEPPKKKSFFERLFGL